MVRGERPIKLGDSWFSPKTIEVVPWMLINGGRALNGLGRLYVVPNSIKLRIPLIINPGDSHRVITSYGKRETTQTIS